MAELTKCEACGNNISTKASTCPQCGHPNALDTLPNGTPNMPGISEALKSTEKGPAKTPNKAIGCCGSLFGFILFSMIVSAVIQGGKKPASEPVAPPPVKTQKEIQAEAKLNKFVEKFGKAPEQSPWNGSYYEVEKHLKHVANDPDSINIEKCTNPSMDKNRGWVVGCDFRGKNAFGGMIRNSNWFVIRNGRVSSVLPADSYR